MGIVSSIKDFIGGEPDFYEFEDFEDEVDYEEEEAEPRRSFSKFYSRREQAEPAPRSVDNDITIIKVKGYDEATSVADVLKTRRPVIFDVIDMETREAERVVDFMVGAVYGLDGSIKRVTGGIFIATPKGMKINSDEIRKKAPSTFGLEL
ncbi:MAG: cell division protein SepF [Clostridia bacterium]|nr:cell division protein SepF [Clostridia bacterium]